MLIVWFGIILTLSLLLVILGYSFKQPPLAIAGSVLIFLLGSVVMFSSLEIQTGYTEDVLAPCNNNCTEIRSGGSIDLYSVTNTTITYIYSDIPEEKVVGVGINHLLGFFLSLIGIFIFIDVIISLKGLK